jgi:hypothetical protein
MRTEKMKTADLLSMAATYNPRKISPHDLDSLRKSIRRFGMVEPVVVNRRTKRIVGGHQRVLACDLEKVETVPVVWVDLDETDERTLNVALNRISGEFDEGKLLQVIEDLKRRGADLDFTGFDSGEIDRLVAKGGVGANDGEVKFAEIMGERQDYVLLVFDNEADFATIQTILGLEAVFDRRSTGKKWKKGIGRVVNGPKAIDAIRKTRDPVESQIDNSVQGKGEDVRNAALGSGGSSSGRGKRGGGSVSGGRVRRDRDGRGGTGEYGKDPKSNSGGRGKGKGGRGRNVGR